MDAASQKAQTLPSQPADNDAALRERWDSLVFQAKQAVAGRRPAEAAICLEEALRTARETWPDTRQFAESCIRLADLRAAMDRRDEALHLYGEGAGIMGDLPGGVGAQLAHAVSNMGRMFLLKGDLAKGEELASAADAILRKIDYPGTPSIKLNLAMAMANAGREAAARQAFEDAVAALDRLQPGDLQGVAVYDNYALYCLSMDRAEEAEILFRRSLILRQEATGPRHPSYAAGVINLARLLLYGGRTEEAESLLRQARDIYERNAGSATSGILSALYYLARIAEQEKHSAEVGRLCGALQDLAASDERAARAADAAVQHVTARLRASGSPAPETESRFRQVLSLAESLDGGYRRLGVDMAADILADLSALMSETRRRPEAERLAARAAEMRGRLLWAVSGHVFMAPD